MNTLGKAITKSFFVNPETGFQELQQAWRAKGPNHPAPSHIHLAYAMLRGKDYRKGFAEVTNEVKIRPSSEGGGGQTVDQGLRVAEMHLHDMGVDQFVEAFGATIVRAEALSLLKLRLPQTGNRLAQDAYVDTPVTITVPEKKEKVGSSWLTDMSTQLFGKILPQ